jgi:cation:H+ antiporter
LNPLVLAEIALVVIATGLLWKGADWVVCGAARIARRFSLSDVVIGMTVVAVGTSAPEIVVTLVAALRDQPDISVGNVVGSNIFNVGFILGSCAALWVIPTNRMLVRRDAAALLVACVLLAICLGDYRLEWWEGLVMMLLLGGYVAYLLRREEAPEELDADGVPEGPASAWDYPMLVLGLAAVLGGAHLLVESAVDLAHALGLSEWAIAVTLVAGGTSLPELACAFAAASRGRPGIVAGNLIGSDLFNVLGVLGLAAVLNPMAIDPGARPSIFMMTAMVGLLVVFMRSGWRLSRAEGLLLIAIAILRWSRDLAPGFWS